MFVLVFLWEDVQQPGLNLRVQEQREVRNHQEEPYFLQSLQTKEMPGGGNVQEWLSLWQKIQLVQDPLSSAGAATKSDAHAALQVQGLGRSFISREEHHGLLRH